MHETLIWWIRTLVPFGGTMFFLINLVCYLKILPLEHLPINYFNQSIRNVSSSFHCLTLSAIQVFCLVLNYNSNGYFTHLTNGRRFYTLGLGFWSKIFNPDLGSWVLKFLFWVLDPRPGSYFPRSNVPGSRFQASLGFRSRVTRNTYHKTPFKID